jgi:hypothetical protein
MPNERKHVKSIEGDTRLPDIFTPYSMGVELFEDMDEVFCEARRAASGEDDDEVTRSWKEFEGQRAVAIITPGRSMMFNSCPEPNSMPRGNNRAGTVADAARSAVKDLRHLLHFHRGTHDRDR